MNAKLVLAAILICPLACAGLAVQEAEDAMKVAAHEGVKNFGPEIIRLAESAGEEAPQAVKLLNRYGGSAIPLVSDARRLHLASLGEESVQAMLKHRGIAEDVIEKFGPGSARALNSLDGQGARRLAMLVQDGTLAQIPVAQREALFDVILKRGDAAMNWIWRNKGALAVGTTLAAFLTKPDVFLQSPIAKGAGSAVKSVGVSFGTVAGAALALAMVIWLLRRKGVSYERAAQKARGRPDASTRD